MSLDLLVPPLALLILVVGVAFSIAWLLFILGGLLVLALIASIGMLLLGLAIISAWAKFGREIVSIVALLYAPFYILKKIPLYLSFLLKRQVDWVRSKRDES